MSAKKEIDAWLEGQASEPVPPGVVRMVCPPSYAHETLVINNLNGTKPLTPCNTGWKKPKEQKVKSHPWVISVKDATREQMLSLRDWLNNNNLSGGKIYAGNISDAFEKEQSNVSRKPREE